MSFPLVIIAGADQDLFNALSATSADRFAPNGARIIKPTHNGLSREHAEALLTAARAELKALRETQPVNIIVLAVSEANTDDAEFRRAFFPFAYYQRINAPDLSNARSVNARNRLRNALVGTLRTTVLEARKRADLVKKSVYRANPGPLVLPLRNFQSRHLATLLETVFDRLPTARDPEALLAQAELEFLRHEPWITPPSSSRRCLSDRRHYFNSPGRHRHGYYQNVKDSDHGLTCLLNARARLGGALVHDFHFDCAPVKKLDRRYNDCHGDEHPPKEGYVNIAPGDGIIGSPKKDTPATS